MYTQLFTRIDFQSLHLISVILKLLIAQGFVGWLAAGWLLAD
jgi:hypothetical protein